MNILFLSTDSYDNLMINSIYKDLFIKFRDEGHHLFVIAPEAANTKAQTEIIIRDQITYIPMKLKESQPVNILERGINAFRLDGAYLKTFKEFFAHEKIDLLLYTNSSVLCVNTISYIKNRDHAKTYLLMKEMLTQKAVDAGYVRKINPAYYLYKRKERQLYETSDHIGCLSPANISYLTARYGQIPSDKVEILPHSLDPIRPEKQFNKSALRVRYQLPLDKIILTYVGSIDKDNGITALINAVRLNEAYEDIFVLIIGTGNELGRLEKFFDEAQPKNARLISEMPFSEYEALLFACDIGIISIDIHSENPVVPTSLLLYMQASLPIIAAVNGNSDLNNLLMRAQCGFSCQSDDYQRIYQLVDLLRFKEYRERLGLNGRKYLEKHFSPAVSYNVIMKHFKERALS